MRSLVALMLLTGLSLAFSAGCGKARPGLKKATGVITLDGAPVGEADVFLQPIETEIKGYKRPSYGRTDAQGQFSLGTYGDGDGVPPGKYSLGVKKWEVVGELPKNYDPENPLKTPVKYKWLTPKKYSEPASSGLQIEVTSKGIVPDKIELQSDGPPQIETIGGRPRGDGT